MRSKHRRVRFPVRSLALAASLVSASWPFGSAWAAPPELSFEESAVVVAGVSPGGEVSLFGIVRGFTGVSAYELRHDAVLVADGEGMARLELDSPLTVRSLWSAVDLATGEVGLGVPRDGVLRVAESVPAIDAERRTITDRRRYADVQWVRPGAAGSAGVWGARLGDGGAGDEDGLEDRSIRAAVSGFTPLAGGEEAPAPDRLAPGDVVVVIDPERLEVAVTRLPASPSEPKG